MLTLIPFVTFLVAVLILGVSCVFVLREFRRSRESIIGRYAKRIVTRHGWKWVFFNVLVLTPYITSIIWMQTRSMSHPATFLLPHFLFGNSYLIILVQVLWARSSLKRLEAGTLDEMRLSPTPVVDVVRPYFWSMMASSVLFLCAQRGVELGFLFLEGRAGRDMLRPLQTFPAMVIFLFLFQSCVFAVLVRGGGILATFVVFTIATLFIVSLKFAYAMVAMSWLQTSMYAFRSITLNGFLPYQELLVDAPIAWIFYAIFLYGATRYWRREYDGLRR